MSKRDNHSVVKRIAIDIGGFSLIILSALTGWLPGPGGLPLLIAGLGLLSLNYEWADNMLKNLEKKRQEITAKYLETDPLTSKIMDGICILIAGLAVWILFTQDKLLFKTLAIGLMFASILILLSNQHRLDRIIAKFRSKKRKH